MPPEWSKHLERREGNLKESEVAKVNGNKVMFCFFFFFMVLMNVKFQFSWTPFKAWVWLLVCVAFLRGTS